MNDDMEQVGASSLATKSNRFRDSKFEAYGYGLQEKFRAVHFDLSKTSFPMFPRAKSGAIFPSSRMKSVGPLELRRGFLEKVRTGSPNPTRT